MGNRLTLHSAASVIGIAFFAACESDNAPNPTVSTSQFLTTCTAYCEKELTCHPDLTGALGDCGTYCKAQSAHVGSDGALSCDANSVVSKFKQCSKDACSEFDQCSKELSRLCPSLAAPTDAGLGRGAGGKVGSGGAAGSAESGGAGGSAGSESVGEGGRMAVPDAGSGGVTTGDGGIGGTMD